MSGWRDRLPAVRGRLAFDEPLAPFTWLRVGGPADVLFLPADEDDLAGFLAGLDSGVPVTPLGVGSNTLVRDGGVEGVVVRLGRPFANIEAAGVQVTAGAAALDAQVAKAAGRAGIGGLEFLTGIPGTVGGAVTMNAGCYGSETKEVLVSAHGLDRQGRAVSFTDPASFSYRHGWGWEEGVIVTRAVFAGHADDAEAVEARMAAISERREQTQPIREKTGGSTFKNPPGESSWKLVDAAGWPMPLSGDLPIAFRILQYSAGRWLLARIDNRPLIEEGLKRDVRNPAVITTPFIDRWAEFQRAPGHRAILVSTAPTSFATATEVALASIAIPTLVLHGEEDTLIAVGNGRRFAAAIPKATLITYPNVGHLPQVEIPGQSAADVAAFLGRLAPAR